MNSGGSAGAANRPGRQAAEAVEWSHWEGCGGCHERDCRGGGGGWIKIKVPPGVGVFRKKLSTPATNGGKPYYWPVRHTRRCCFGPLASLPRRRLACVRRRLSQDFKGRRVLTTSDVGNLPPSHISAAQRFPALHVLHKPASATTPPRTCAHGRTPAEDYGALGPSPPTTAPTGRRRSRDSTRFVARDPTHRNVHVGLEVWAMGPWRAGCLGWQRGNAASTAKHTAGPHHLRPRKGIDVS